MSISYAQLNKSAEEFAPSGPDNAPCLPSPLSSRRLHSMVFPVRAPAQGGRTQPPGERRAGCDRKLGA
jgi:hypothetical protein